MHAYSNLISLIWMIFFLVNIIHSSNQPTCRAIPGIVYKKFDFNRDTQDGELIFVINIVIFWIYFLYNYCLLPLLTIVALYYLKKNS